MIGNDVVDFAQAAKESNWRRIGWLEKIFVAEEQVLIKDAANPDCMVWLLWSMKEAAYKAHQRKTQGSPRFNPKSFICLLNHPEINFNLGQAESIGRVSVGNTNYRTKSKITNDFVHSLASLEAFFFSGNSEIIKNPKKEDIFNKLEAYLPKNRLNDYQLEKDGLGIPYIVDGQDRTSFLISLSHHGRFGGFFLAI